MRGYISALTSAKTAVEIHTSRLHLFSSFFHKLNLLCVEFGHCNITRHVPVQREWPTGLVQIVEVSQHSLCAVMQLRYKPCISEARLRITQLIRNRERVHHFGRTQTCIPCFLAFLLSASVSKAQLCSSKNMQRYIVNQDLGLFA